MKSGKGLSKGIPGPSSTDKSARPGQANKLSKRKTPNRGSDKMPGAKKRR